MEKIKAIMEYIDVSNCRMEEGNLRADINVSLRPVGTKELGTRTEMKNINSFKNLEDAINYEIERQEDVLEDGGHIVQRRARSTRPAASRLDAQQRERPRLPLHAGAGPAANRHE